MRNLTPTTITQAFADYARNAPSARARSLLVSLAGHLHAFARENKLTQAEWGAAIDALTRAFRTRTDRRGFCTVGSVKANIGHLEQTAGLAAIIKTALALKFRQIPPQIHFRTANPKIDFAASPFVVSTELRDWPSSGAPRFAAVNSLGVGGTNAFLVLEEAPALPAITAEEGRQHLFTLSARSDAALAVAIAPSRSGTRHAVSNGAAQPAACALEGVALAA